MSNTLPSRLLRVSLCGALVAGGAVFALAGPSRAAGPQATECTIPQPAFVNGGFETPAVAANSSTGVNAANTATPASGVGWSTNDPRGSLEFWSTGFQGVPSDTGNQFIEVNATATDTIWQDIATTPGTVIHYSFAHRGRSGPDVMNLTAGSPSGTATVITTATDSNTAWGHYSGTYSVPAGQTTTRFSFASVSSTGGDPSVGNFVDSLAISVSSNACDDTATALQGATTTIPVLANDQGTGLTASLPAGSTAPSHGTVALSGAGTGNAVTYKPAAGFAGTDTFTYTATDVYGSTSTATVTVTVPPLPTAPNLTSTGNTPNSQNATIAIPTGGSATLLDSTGKAVSSVTVAGQGTYSLAGSTVTFTPLSGFSGTATPATYRVTDSYGQTASGTYTPTVKPTPPTASALTSTAVGPAAQSVTPTVPAGDTLTMLDGTGASVTTLTVAGQGTYSLASGTITFTPLGTYVGTATPVTYAITDGYGQSAQSTYTPTETRPAAPTAAPVTTTGAGTAPESATVSVPANGAVTLLDAGGNPATSVTVAGQGTYALSGSTITFTPVNGFSGTATAVRYRVTDAYGQTATSTDTPTVTKPTGPTAAPLTSTGTGTAPEPVSVTVPSGGSATLLDAAGNVATSVTVAGQGTYAISGSTITFTPVNGFSGTATAVRYRVTDAYGQTSTSTDTPTVAKPAGPSAAPLTSTGRGTAVESVTPAVPAGGSFQLLDGTGASVQTVTVAGQGTYAASGTTITFTPVNGFAGTATPASYRLTDAYGQTSTSTDTPTVTKPAGPSATPLTSTGRGTAVESVTPAVPAGGSFQLLDGTGASVQTVTVAGQGTYAASGTTITFTPVNGYTGTATPASYRLTDAYGQTSTSTDTPTVTKPVGPTATPLTSSGTGTAVQTVNPAVPAGGSLQLLDGTGASVQTLTVAGQGTYALSGSTITFTPVNGYTGTATPATYQLTDAYGQTSTSTDTPTVAAPGAPNATPLTSTGSGTTVQSVTPTVPAGDSLQLLDGSGTPVTSYAVPGQGTYALSGGSLRFTPVNGFAGTATAATYQITDQFGQASTSSYTPTVTKPAPPVVTPPLTSTGVGTAPQTATVALPTGGSATLLDAAGNPATTVTVAGQGTYVLSGSTITFTPVNGYVGTATPVVYRLTDAYAQTAQSTDTPTVTKPAGPTAAPLTSTGTGTAPQSVTPAVPAGGSLQLLDGTGASVPSVTVAGQGTYAVSGSTITFTPVNGFAGTATPATYQLTDAYGQTATNTDTPTVGKPAGPTATALTSAGTGTAPEPVDVAVPTGGSATLLDAAGNTATTVTVAGQGTYTKSGKTITFTPVLGFAGTATPVTYRVTDAYGQTATNTDTPTVTKPAGPTAPALTSTGVGTAVQTVTPTVPSGGSFQLLDASGAAATSVTVAGQGTYAVSGSTITFTPVNGFAGTATAASYRVTDAYGQSATGTDTPTVTKPAGPTAPALTSTGTGTAPQTATVAVPTGTTATLLDAAGNPATSVTVAGQGTYVLSGSTVTFTPVNGFAGTATAVRYRVTDAYGQSATGTDTPTVAKPDAPAAGPLTSTGVGTAPEKATFAVPSGGSATLLDAGGAPATSVTVTGQGTYAISGGTITFTPVNGFAGTATPVTYQLTDAYGTSSASTDTPTVTAPAGPTAAPVSSTGVGTAPQTATVGIPTGGSATLLDAAGRPASSVTLDPTQGTYTITGSTITFTPVNGFAGTATPVTYRLTDAYGTSSTDTDTPAVSKPAGPTAPALTSTGVGPAPQTATVAIPAGGSAQLLDAGGNLATSVTRNPAQGTYTISGSTITFTPVSGFAGTADPVSYQVTDAYSQNARGTDTPTVGRPTAPTAPAVTSTGVGTAPESAHIVIPAGDTATLLDAAGNPVTTVTVPGQGSYVLSGDTITFTPVDGFAGTATPARYQITDVYGQSATGTDTAKPTAPAAPTPPGLTSTGLGDAPQTATVSIPAGGSVTLLDATGTPTTTLTVARQGTYTLSGDTITFTPVAGFAGTATPVSYRVTDSYGQTGTAPYTPTVTNPNGPTAPALTSEGTAPASQSVTVTVPADGSVTLLDAAGDPATTVTVTGQGTYVLSGDTITFTPATGFSGAATPVTYQLTDAYGQSQSAPYTPTVDKPAAAPAPDVSSSGTGSEPQTATLTVPAGDTATLLDAAGNPATTVTVAGEGSYVLSGSTITFTPVDGFSGAATPVSYRITDAYGTTSTGTDSATVDKPAAPTTPALTSTGVGTEPQSVSPQVPDGDTLTLLDAAGNPVTTVAIPGQGTYRLADDVLTFTPVSGFAGTATPVRYRVTDAYGTSSTGTDTATVSKPDGPTAPALSSSGRGTAPQTVTPAVPDGDDLTLLDAAGDPATTVTVAGQGAYVLSGGTITFTPVTGFAGTATPVDYRITDPYGTAATGTDTPTVTDPAGPPAPAYTSTGVGAEPQSVTPGVPTGGSLTLLDAAGDPATTVTVPGQGTYAVSGGTITFTPADGFSGTATPVGYAATGADGTESDGTYTPTVTKPTPPPAGDVTSSGVGTAPQSATPAVPAGDTMALLDAAGQPVSTVTVPGEGTFVLGADGTITFTPATGFVGTATAPFRLTDAYGQTSTGSYAATVGAPAGPNAVPVTSTGVGTAPQSASPAVPTGGTLTLLDAAGDPATAVTVAGQGRYALSGGKIVFTPVAGFSGAATPVAYRVTDAYGQSSTSTDSAVVDKPAAPAVTGGSVTGAAGSPVTGGVRGAGTGPLTYAVGTGPTHGTVTVDPTTGTYTYVPDPGYSGPDTFTVTAADAYDQTSAPATVTLAVRPTAHGGTIGTDAGTPVHGAVPTPIGTGPLVSTVVTQPAHGTVTLAADGSYVYTPDPGYTGTDSFSYVVTDPAGDVSAPARITVTVHGAAAVVTTTTTPTATAPTTTTAPGITPATEATGALPFTGAAAPIGSSLDLGSALVLGGLLLLLGGQRVRRRRHR